MSFPNTTGKHSFDPFFTPQELIEYAKKTGRSYDFPVPKGVILIYHNSLLKQIEESGSLRLIPDVFAGKFYILEKEGVTIGVCGGFGIGPSSVVTVMEELVAIGVTNFLSIGTAGGLQKRLNIGDVVMCDKAIRDEGVSHHYLESSKYSHTSESLTAAFKSELEKSNLNPTVGTTWTIDAPYRETVEELKSYQAEGVLTVEMEASALAAVAQYRKVEFATAYAISDSLADLVWNPSFSSPHTAGNLRKIYDSALETIIKL